MCYILQDLNDHVSLEDKNEKCLRSPQLSHNDPAGMFVSCLCGLRSLIDIETRRVYRSKI